MRSEEALFCFISRYAVSVIVHSQFDAPPVALVTLWLAFREKANETGVLPVEFAVHEVGTFLEPD